MSEEQKPVKRVVVDWDVAQGLYLKGVRVRDIATASGASEAAIKKRALRHGWTVVKRNLEKANAVAPVVAAVPAAEADIEAASRKARAAAAREVGRSLEVLESIPVVGSIPKLKSRSEVAKNLVGVAAQIFTWENKPPMILDIRPLRNPRVVTDEELAARAAGAIDVPSETQRLPEAAQPAQSAPLADQASENGS